MKGILKLNPIENPVQGMQVVYSDSIEEIASIISDNEIYLRDFDGEDTCKPSELQQIVVEYTEVLHKNAIHTHSVPIKKLLPLHPSDWKEALGKIGKEVEFEVTDTKEVEKFEFDGTEQGELTWKEVAKLIPSTPVTYSEDETKELAWKSREFPHHYSKEGQIYKQFESWWSKFKKK